MIIPVSEKFADYAESVRAQLEAADLRVTVNNQSDTLGKRIRTAQKEKSPTC